MSSFIYLGSDGEQSVEFDCKVSERTLTVNGQTYQCDGQSIWLAGKRVPFWVSKQGETVSVWLDGEVFNFISRDPRQRDRRVDDSGIASGAIKAQMPGKILTIAVQVGNSVSKGQNLLVMESMKMELALDAPCDGVVESLSVDVGQMVGQGDLLVQLKTDES